MSSELSNTASTSAVNDNQAASRSKIDALSREDLIRFVKKQIEKLKSFKAANERLEARCAQLERSQEELQESRNSESKKAEALQTRHDELESQYAIVTAQLAEWETKFSEQSNTVSTECRRDGFRDVNLDDSKISNIESVKIGSIEKSGAKLELSETLKLQNELKAVKKMFEETTTNLKEVSMANDALEMKVSELYSALDDSNHQLTALKERHCLESVKSLEVADYEKSVDRLQKELKTMKVEQSTTSDELNALKEQFTNISSERDRLNDELKSSEANCIKLVDEMSGLREDLASMRAEITSQSIRFSERSSENEIERAQLCSALGESEERIKQLQNSVASMERQLISSRTQRDSLQRQYDELLKEHNAFKARALYVLEQKKGDNDTRTNSDVELLEDTIKQQKKAMENSIQARKVLQEELDSSVEQGKTLSNELISLKRKFAANIDAHKQELNEQRHQLESRLASEARLNSELLAQIDANFVAHAQEKENLLAGMKRDKENLMVEMDRLRNLLDDEIKRRRDAEKIQAPESISIRTAKPVEIPMLTQNFTRQSFSNPLSPSIDITDRSLKEVIYEDVHDVVTPSKEWIESIDFLQENFQSTTKQLDHARELLNESEATNARMVEQIRVLKDEIRRLERNQQRTQELTNNEYLKNVIIKFIAPEKVSDEREQLIPVLKTMLKLNDDEIKLLYKVTENNGPDVDSKSGNWGSYIHRWSGFS